MLYLPFHMNYALPAELASCSPDGKLWGSSVAMLVDENFGETDEGTGVDYYCIENGVGMVDMNKSQR